LVLSLLAVLVTAQVTERVFEGIPHLEDEIAYVWQAKVFASGNVKISSPTKPQSFIVPFVVDHDGERFGKYPPGWPALLSLGIRLGIRSWVNPLLAGLGVWLTYRLGKRIFNDTVGIIAAGLTLTSPFFLMNSGSLLSHPFGLVLSASFALAWLGAFGERRVARVWLSVIIAGLSLGLLLLTRPFTAVAISLPFVLYSTYLFVRSPWQTRNQLLVIVAIVLGFGGLYLLWQNVLTGDPFLNPYTLWWPYDKIGFGPGHGHTETGHTISKAYYNTRHSLRAGAYDLFGWGPISWIFIPFGVWAARRNRDGLLLGSVFPCMVIVYLAYWIGSWLFGPRYFYEGLYSLTVLSAAGITFLAGWPLKPDESWVTYTGWRKLRPLLITAVVGVLVSINLILYAPIRLESMQGLYGIERSDQAPFLTQDAKTYTPALIIVHTDKWMEYGSFLDLEDPFLSTPFIYAWNLTPEIDAGLSLEYPDRSVFHYYPDTPFVFYTAPRPEQ
jgi:hypothetical protein